ADRRRNARHMQPARILQQRCPIVSFSRCGGERRVAAIVKNLSGSMPCAVRQEIHSHATVAKVDRIGFDAVATQFIGAGPAQRRVWQRAYDARAMSKLM